MVLHSFTKETDERLIEQHNTEFGIRWLLKRLSIFPNAYYNYRKHRKVDYYIQKEAAEYYHIGENKLHMIADEHSEVDFIILNSNRIFD